MSTCPWNVHNGPEPCQQGHCPANVTADRHASRCLYNLFGGRTDLSTAELAFGLGLRPIDLRQQLVAEQTEFQSLVWLVNQIENASACTIPWSERQINMHIAEEVLAEFPFNCVVSDAKQLHCLVEYCVQRNELHTLCQHYPQLRKLRDYHEQRKHRNANSERSPRG